MVVSGANEHCGVLGKTFSTVSRGSYSCHSNELTVISGAKTLNLLMFGLH